MSRLLKCEKLNFIRSGRSLIKDFSWEIEKGENWILFGPNGSGKTTLIKLIMGHEFSMSGGLIYYGDNQKPGGNLWEIRKKIGFVSSDLQEHYLPHITGLEVVQSGFFSSNGLYEIISDKMLEATKKWINYFGLEALVKREYSTLSYGEQRRFLLARSMVHEPELLILDEPCTGLDYPNREKFLLEIEKLSEMNTNIIYICHHPDEITKIFNKIILLKDGTIFKSGKVEEILSGKALSVLFGMPISVDKYQDRFILQTSE